MEADGFYSVDVPPNKKRDGFNAGVTIQQGRIVEAAPILRWLTNKTFEDLRWYIASKGGTITRVS